MTEKQAIFIAQSTMNMSNEMSETGVPLLGYSDIGVVIEMLSGSRSVRYEISQRTGCVFASLPLHLTALFSRMTNTAHF
jgi:hypothetical protein